MKPSCLPAADAVLQSCLLSLVTVKTGYIPCHWINCSEFGICYLQNLKRRTWCHSSFFVVGMPRCNNLCFTLEGMFWHTLDHLSPSNFTAVWSPWIFKVYPPLSGTYVSYQGLHLPILAHLVWLTWCHQYSGPMWCFVKCPDDPDGSFGLYCDLPCRVNIALCKIKCVWLYIWHEYELLLILFPDGNRKDHICSINGCIVCTWGYINLL